MHLGTLLLTRFFGELVGTDQYGNRYYRSSKLRRYQRERRWVIYKGTDEASKVPPEWHAWLHHTAPEPLTDRPRYSWQKPHLPNLTGTAHSYRPLGHELMGGQRARATGDYEAWVPE